MSAPRDTTRFPDPAFLRVMLRVAAAAAVIGLALGAALPRDARFALSFALVAGVDIAAVGAALARYEGGRPAGTAGALFGVRLAAKALLLAVAAALPSALDLAGAAAGALVFDTTLLVVGSVTAARTTFPLGSGPHRRGPSAIEGGV